MKSIRTFIEGKIRRSEVQHELRVEDGEPHDELGGHEGRLIGPAEAIDFHERGLVLPDREIVYEQILAVTVTIGPPTTVDIGFVDGSGVRMECSASGAQIVHATLRWVGNTRLRRKIAK